MADKGTAIVTGAGKRVGWDIAQALAERGWSVLAHVREDGDAVPAGAHAIAANLASPDCAERIFSAAETLPPVRLLVNNASRFAWDGFGEFSAREFDAHMHINVRAPLMLIDELAKRHPGGDALVVNVTDAKLAMPNADFLSYTVSKQALAGLTEVAARVFAGRSIRVNAIAPGLMLRSPGQTEENFRKMHGRNPLGRGVCTADVVAAIDYLLVARSVTGEMLTLDSGQRFDPPVRDVQFLED